MDLNSCGSRKTTALRIFPIHHKEIDFKAEFSRAFKTFNIVADIKAVHHQLAGSVFANDGEHVDDGQIARKLLAGIIENSTDGRIRATHHALHTVNRTKKMGAVNR